MARKQDRRPPAALRPPPPPPPVRPAPVPRPVEPARSTPARLPPTPPPQSSAPRLPARPEPLRSAPAPGPRPRIVVDEEWAGDEHRHFPRANLSVPFALTIGEPGDLRFSAALSSVNISVSGAFLESSYFLPMGTNLAVRFSPDPEAPPVLARAEIVRQERSGDRPGYGHDGFALRFTEFFDQSEVTLAKLFVGQKLRAFAETYMQSKRARALHNELDRVVDALAAWELRKVVSSEDIWLHPGG